VHSATNAAVNADPVPSSAPTESNDASASTPSANHAAKPEASESKPAVAEAGKTAKLPQDETKANSKAHASAGPAYVVQVAALSDSARAKQLQKQMSGVGIKAYTEVVATKSGDITRVRAGPYTSREAAEKARTQLKKAGVEGKVVPR
jgi:DedD protein